MRMVMMFTYPEDKLEIFLALVRQLRVVAQLGHFPLFLLLFFTLNFYLSFSSQAGWQMVQEKLDSGAAHRAHTTRIFNGQMSIPFFVN